MEGVLAVVTCFAADFAPKGWATCDGQILAISTNQALFALLGTTYGGNGVNTFGLPDLRGRTALSQGQGPGLSNYDLGQAGGSENINLNSGNLPAHVHNGTVNLYLNCDPTRGVESGPDGFYAAGFTGGYNTPGPGGKNMLPPTYTANVALAGGNQPVEILQPYLVVNYIICLSGIFPSRN